MIVLQKPVRPATIGDSAESPIFLALFIEIMDRLNIELQKPVRPVTKRVSAEALFILYINFNYFLLLLDNFM